MDGIRVAGLRPGGSGLGKYRTPPLVLSMSPRGPETACGLKPKPPPNEKRPVGKDTGAKVITGFFMDSARR